MELTWTAIKEAFFALGSVAGVVALLRPMIEAKLQRDSQRVERIKQMINEQKLVDLEGRIYAHRQILCDEFDPYDQLTHERRTNQEVVRFTGPTGKHLGRELDAILAAYSKLREFIQVNEWESTTQKVNGMEDRYWVFNKKAFEDRNGVPRDYTQHLDGAAHQAVRMKQAFQRFQIVAELHLFELPLAWWLLPRRFKTHGLRDGV